MLNENVELLLGLLVVVSLATDSNTDLAWYISDSLLPHESVKGGVDAHVLLGKLKIRTFVNISFVANRFISLIALGALFLNAIPCNFLCMFIV